MNEKDRWNRCRYSATDKRGHYESFFLRANHPHRPLAFWIRYTVFSPKGRPHDAVGELWAIYFDGERNQITATKEVYPIKSCQLSSDRLEVRIGDAVLSEGYLAGRASSGMQTLKWDLRYTGSQSPLLLLPRSFYEREFPKAKALVGTPNAIFDGVIIVNDENIQIDHWTGSQNHNWGQKHTDSYAWGQIAGFDNAPDVFLECSTAKLRLGPFWVPALTVLVLRIEGYEIRLNSIVQAFCARASFDFTSWRFESGNAEIRVSAHIHAPTSAFVGLVYNNPPGSTKTCLNTKLAACELVVEQQGRSKQTFITKNRAAFEILTDRNDHAVPIVF